MWKYKIKRRLFQYIVIGILLMVTSAVLTGCLNFSKEIDNYAKNYYESVKCPNLFLGFNDEEGYSKLVNDEEITDKITNLGRIDGILFEGAFKVENKEISCFYPTVIPTNNVKDLTYELRSYKGSKASCPAEGEIWISNVYANSTGIKVGSILTINTDIEIKLKISALYSSVITPTSGMAYSPMIINPADKDLFNGNEIILASMDIDSEATEKIIADRYDIYTYFRYNKTDLIESFSTVSVISGAIGMLAAIVTFVVALILIRYIVASNLTKEYKMIGIYKSLGYTNRNIKGIYLKSYVFIGLIATAIGGVLSLILSRSLCVNTAKFLGEYKMQSSVWFFVIVVPIVLTAIIAIITWLSLKGITKLDPTEALAIGFNSTPEKVKKSVFKKAANPFTRGINNIFKKPRMSLLLLIIMTVSIYLSLLFVNVHYTASTMGNHLDVWFGAPKTDCYVEGAIDNELYQKINDSQYTKTALRGNFMPESLKICFPDDDMDLTETTISVFDNYSKVGFDYTKGRGPNAKYEIAASNMFLKMTNLHVGDYVRLTVKNDKKDFTTEFYVSGTYSTMMNGGEAVQVMSELLEENDIYIDYNIAGVNLTKSSDFKLFKEEINAEYQNVRIDVQYNTIKDATKSIVDIIKPICLIFISVFMVYSLLNVFNILLMNYLANRRKYGIVKALGTNDKSILLENITQISILTVISMFLATIMNALISAPMFNTILGVEGFISSNGYIMIILAIVFCIIILITTLFIIPVKRINPTELMEE